jgi:hypothetical protein
MITTIEMNFGLWNLRRNDKELIGFIYISMLEKIIEKL